MSAVLSTGSRAAAGARSAGHGPVQARQGRGAVLRDIVGGYVARSVLRSVARRVPVEFRLPGGARLADVAGEPQGAVEIVRPRQLWRRLAANPKIGIGEGYTAGDWRVAEGHDLADTLRPFAERMTSAVPAPLMRLRRLVDRPMPRAQRNTPDGSRRNIEAHYDLSNALFETFLDRTLTYSSALFDDAVPWSEQDLAAAQVRKVEAVLDLAEVGEGTRLLEIGTGWGTLALAAARRGAHVTTLTLSHEQAELASARVREAGLGHLVEVRLEDYREVAGEFDAVVSVEMIEAVGEEYWPTYFAAIDGVLAPGGRVAIQGIVMAHDRYLATRRSYGWIQKHIFPGGLIPSVRAIEETTSTHTGLRVDSVSAFGLHYAETLRRWREQFTASTATVAALGFDEEFQRTWEFYLAYCEAGFASGYLDVVHVRLSRPMAA